MRILHVIASVAPRFGGPSVAAVEMCAALAAAGQDVELFTTNRGDPDVALEPQHRGGFTTTYFPVAPPRAFGTSPALARALRRRIATFDVVHIHSLFLFHGLVAAHLARRAGVPYLVRPHGTLNPYHRRIRAGRKALYTKLVERRNLERAEAVHCTSEEEADNVRALFPRANCVVIPLGVHPAPRAAVSADDGAVVTFLGRLTAKKRPELLVEAFAGLAPARMDARLVLAGPDDEGLGARVAALAEGLGVADRVALPGLLDRSEVRALLARSAVFVLPSADENFGVAAAEAMAAGVPVVLTRGVAGHAEIEARGAGIVAEPTPQGLAAALERVLDDRELASRMGERGRALTADRYDWARVSADLVAVYEKAIA